MDRECSIPKFDKLFICTQNPSKSFIVSIKEEDYYCLSLQSLFEKANFLFTSLNNHFEIDKQSFESFYAKSPSLDQILVNTQFNLLPIYFKERQILFELDIQYRDDVFHLVLPYEIEQTEFLFKLSEQLNISQKNIYLVKDKQVIREPLNKYYKIELYSTDGVIYIDDKEYYVVMDLPLNVHQHVTQFFKESESINMEKSLKELGFSSGEKFVSFYLIDVIIKKTPTKIKNTYSRRDIRKLYNELYPNENGFIAQSCNNETIQFYKVQFSQIFIKTLTGTRITIYCECRDSVEDLKVKIQNKEGVPPDQQRLVYDDKELDDRFIIDHYGFFREDELYLILRLRGGGNFKEFVDLENQNSKKIMPFSKNAPIYRQACSGINIEGYCKNKECPYFDKLVISQIGYQSIEIIQDIYDQIKCPSNSCIGNIKLVTCGFTNCLYKWSGIKVEQRKDKHVHSSLQTAERGNYIRYNPVNDNGTSNTALWKQLFLFAKPIESDQYECSICMKFINEENEITTFEVCLSKENHKCHKNCFEKISTLLKKCPLCLTTIAFPGIEIS